MRSTMRALLVRAMLGVPLVQTGVLFLDNEHEPGPFAHSTRDVSVTFADLAAA